MGLTVHRPRPRKDNVRQNHATAHCDISPHTGCGVGDWPCDFATVPDLIF